MTHAARTRPDRFSLCSGSEIKRNVGSLVSVFDVAIRTYVQLFEDMLGLSWWLLDVGTSSQLVTVFELLARSMELNDLSLHASRVKP